MANHILPPEPVFLYVEEDRRVPMTVAKQIEQERQSLIDGLVDGSALDFAQYREKVGEIRGLTTAILICQEAEKQLSGN